MLFQGRQEPCFDTVRQLIDPFAQAVVLGLQRIEPTVGTIGPRPQHLSLRSRFLCNVSDLIVANRRFPY